MGVATQDDFVAEIQAGHNVAQAGCFRNGLGKKVSQSVVLVKCTQLQHDCMCELVVLYHTIIAFTWIFQHVHALA